MKISILTFVECSSLEWKKCSLWPTAVEAEAVQIHYVRALQNGASDVSTPVRLAQARGLDGGATVHLGVASPPPSVGLRASEMQQSQEHWGASITAS
eukprot:CAMPEP_0172667000 /NCGR_PEP_ID=MMETSP1074-20121228/8155_1 /TAXON_ID=2916 /ORGANISM="Ceratium fusus, Strain PA161109" /LENGTH=96 /DNA_ID=CAMNT_0013483453 /DNA_START=128 /DNA_END=419 /DNA_ORIENTATION=-